MNDLAGHDLDVFEVFTDRISAPLVLGFAIQARLQALPIEPSLIPH